ncbi:MAG TPA: hypothetical protein VIK91_20190 [Nannocystis sp.]
MAEHLPLNEDFEDLLVALVLIANKMAAGRPKDLEDARRLESLGGPG